MNHTLTQETTTYVDLEGNDREHTFWFDAEGMHIFTLDHEYEELWDEQALNPDLQFIAQPKTLEQARSIIESKGYTIA